MLFSFAGSGDHRDLHSFPTRRSSDLPHDVIEVAVLLEGVPDGVAARVEAVRGLLGAGATVDTETPHWWGGYPRSEEHTSELQSRRDLVCRLLLEKKKKKT